MLMLAWQARPKDKIILLALVNYGKAFTSMIKVQVLTWVFFNNTLIVVSPSPTPLKEI